MGLVRRSDAAGSMWIEFGMNKFKFQNKLDEALRFYLEPWGDEFILSPNADITIDIIQIKQRLLETRLEDGVFTIWLWGGCRAEVHINGEKQERPWLSIPVP
jgi:hypothetical protein